jgi:hypothetical protein
MIDVEQAIKWVSLVNAILWTVLISLWVVGAIRSIHPAEIAGIKLFPELPIFDQTNPPPEIGQVGKAILVALYEVFKWVLLSVTVLLGIETALGLAGQVLGFIGINIGRGAGQLGKFIGRIIQLLLIKVIVDYTISYLQRSGSPVMFQIEQAFLNSWLGWVTVFLSTAIVAYIIIKELSIKVEVILP